jgi:hypothetical protein
MTVAKDAIESEHYTMKSNRQGGWTMSTTTQVINKTTFRNLALKGYDPVAYFTEGRAIEGREEFAHEFADAQWRFVNAEHRDRFAADPERYAPQYGGYCAWGISQAKFYDGDPRVWKIVGGRLYVNYNEDIEKTWEQDIPGYIQKADSNWPTLKK